MPTVGFYSKEQVDDKVAAILPPTTGASEGQVLGLDANLEPAWINGGGGGPSTTINLSDSANLVDISGISTSSTTSVYGRVSVEQFYEIENIVGDAKVISNGMMINVKTYTTPVTLTTRSVSAVRSAVAAKLTSVLGAYVPNGTYDVWVKNMEVLHRDPIGSYAWSSGISPMRFSVTNGVFTPIGGGGSYLIIGDSTAKILAITKEN